MIRHLRHRTVTVCLSASLLVACAGPEGPMGPSGPTGPTGPQGPQGPQGTTRLMLTVTLSGVGNGTVTLPVGVGSAASPPALTCYMADAIASGVWISVADGYSSDTPYCGLVWNGASWNAVMIQGEPFWVGAFVVIY